jgi:hypothetical protein
MAPVAMFGASMGFYMLNTGGYFFAPVATQITYHAWIALCGETKMRPL